MPTVKSDLQHWLHVPSASGIIKIVHCCNAYMVLLMYNLIKLGGKNETNIASTLKLKTVSLISTANYIPSQVFIYVFSYYK